jgi:hypothetical protein
MCSDSPAQITRLLVNWQQGDAAGATDRPAELPIMAEPDAVLGVTAQMMRNIRLDRARNRLAAKRAWLKRELKKSSKI